MAVKIHCPNPECGQKYSVQESHLGRRVACRKCGLEFRLSAGPEDTGSGGHGSKTDPPPAAPAAAPPREDRPLRDPRPAGGGPSVWCIGPTTRCSTARWP